MGTKSHEWKIWINETVGVCGTQNVDARKLVVVLTPEWHVRKFGQRNLRMYSCFVEPTRQPSAGFLMESKQRRDNRLLVSSFFSKIKE